MGSILTTLLSLAAAGTMMVSAPLDAAAPQHDIDGNLFLINRQWRVSKYFIPENTRQAEVPGQVRTMRADAAAALEEMYAACKAESKITLTSVSGYRSYTKQSTLCGPPRCQRASTGPGHGRGPEGESESQRILC